MQRSSVGKPQLVITVTVKVKETHLVNWSLRILMFTLNATPLSLPPGCTAKLPPKSQTHTNTHLNPGPARSGLFLLLLCYPARAVTPLVCHSNSQWQQTTGHATHYPMILPRELGGGRLEEEKRQTEKFRRWQREEKESTGWKDKKERAKGKENLL